MSSAPPPHGPHPARRFAPLFLVAISVLLSLGIAEALLRHRMPAGGAHFEHRIPDPALGWRLAAGVRYTNANAEFATEVRYNGAGYRDVDHPPGPAEAFRIVVLGDSFMEAFSVELAEQFTRRLEAHLAAAGRETEVINLGVGGYGTLQAYRAYLHDGRRYAPDLVLLGAYVANDVRNNSQALESRLWRARGAADHIKLKNRPFLVPGAEDTWEVTGVDYEASLARYRAARERAAHSVTGWFQRHFALARLARAALAEYRNVARRQSGARADDAAWLGVYACEPMPAYDEAWRITGRILRRLASDVRAQGAALAVFSVPAFQEVDAAHRSRILASVTHPDRYCIEDAPGNARIAALLRDATVPFVDLLPVFREAERAPLFRRTDAHWNAAAHDLAARSVARALVEARLVP